MSSGIVHTRLAALDGEREHRTGPELARAYPPALAGLVAVPKTMETRMKWRSGLAAGLLVPIPAFAEICAGLGDAVCAGEPARAEMQAPIEGTRENAGLPIPAHIRIHGKGDAEGLLPGEPACMPLGDTSCR